MGRSVAREARSGFGAFEPLPDAPAKVFSRNRQRSESGIRAVVRLLGVNPTRPAREDLRPRGVDTTTRPTAPAYSARATLRMGISC